MTNIAKSLTIGILIVAIGSTAVISQTGLPTPPKVPAATTAKVPSTQDVTKLLEGITKDTKSLDGLVSKAISTGALDKTKGGELLSSVKGLQGSADGIYKGVKGGKNIMSMTSDVKGLMGHASKVDKLVGGVPGLKDVTKTWDGLEGKINSLSKIARL